MTVPTDDRLPNSGQPISYALLNPSGQGRVDNYLTRASDYGDVTAYWQGVELTVNARTNGGLTLQGGVTTGAGTRDNCEITSKVPELLIVLGVQQAISSCHVEEPWLPAWRGLVNYTIPKIDVQLSAIMRSQPNLAATNDPASNGASVAGNLIVPNGLVQPVLGRPLAGNAANVTRERGAAGRRVPGAAQHGRHAGFEDPPLRPHAQQRGDRPLQHVQREHRHRLQRHVRHVGHAGSPTAPPGCVRRRF